MKKSVFAIISVILCVLLCGLLFSGCEPNAPLTIDEENGTEAEENENISEIDDEEQEKTDVVFLPDNVINGDFSYFAGEYKVCPYAIFEGNGSDVNINLDQNGVISSSEYTFAGVPPKTVVKSDNGAYICTITDGNEYFDTVAQVTIITENIELFLICPDGVSCNYEKYPDYDETVGTQGLRIRYICIGSRMIDTVYYKSE